MRRKVRASGELKAPWTARLNMGQNTSIASIKPYEPQTIARKSAINWNKGTTVMVIKAEEAEDIVNQARTRCFLTTD